MSADRFVRAALTAITKSPKLAECTQESFLQSMLSLSQLGLEPDGKQASLIPYGKSCTLVVGYQGLAKLAYQSGMISTIHADVVCENDEFEYDRGEVKKHKIDLKKSRGTAYAAYAIVKFKDGGEKADVMGRDEIEAIRKRSPAGNNGPWVTDWSEMSKKTVFRRLAKWIPQSSELQKAADLDHDQFDFAVSSVTIPQPQGDTRTDELAALLGSRNEEPPADDREPGSDDLPVFDGEQPPPPSDDFTLSEFALKYEERLHDPKIDKLKNATLKQEIGADKMLVTQEKNHLLAVVKANEERLKK